MALLQGSAVVCVKEGRSDSEGHESFMMHVPSAERHSMSGHTADGAGGGHAGAVSWPAGSGQHDVPARLPSATQEHHWGLV